VRGKLLPSTFFFLGGKKWKKVKTCGKVVSTCFHLFPLFGTKFPPFISIKSSPPPFFF
jgi:hypothetical protein